MRLWKDPETGTAAGGHFRWKTGVMSKSSGSDYFSRNHDNRGELPPPPGFGSGMGSGTGMGTRTGPGSGTGMGARTGTGGGGDRNGDVGKKK